MRATREQLQYLRERLGLTQVRMSQLGNTPLRTWKAWESRPDSKCNSTPPGIALSFALLLDLMVREGYKMDDLERYLREVTEKITR